MLVWLSCVQFCDLTDCSPPGSSVQGISQARILDWAAILFSRGIFPTQASNLGLQHCRQILYHLGHQGKLIENWVLKKCGMSIQNTLKNSVYRGLLYGQATQDGCSLVHYTYHAMLSQRLLHLYATHRTNLPI